MDITKALEHLFPSGGWTNTNDTLEGIIWPEGEDPKTVQEMQTSYDDYELSNTLNIRLTDVSTLFDQKLAVGFSFNDPGGNPQIFESTDSGLKWLDRSALRARKSKDDTEGKTFKARAKGRVKIVLTDDELIDLASNCFDLGTSLDDVMQDHKDALYDIFEGPGAVSQRQTDLLAYDIESGW